MSTAPTGQREDKLSEGPSDYIQRDQEFDRKEITWHLYTKIRADLRY